MIGIYAITNKLCEKRYVGKSKNVKERWYAHKWSLKKKKRPKDCNIHLWNAVQKYGIENFEFTVLEEFETCDEEVMKTRELFWMDFHKTTDRNFGYNLRRDSATKMIVHPETAAKISLLFQGEKNPNFGNNWSDSQKSRMSKIVKERHSSGKFYSKEWRAKIGQAASETWKDETLKRQMAAKISKIKEKWDFHQFDRSGNLLKIWTSIKEIVLENPTYKWQNIYSVCNGYKPTYHGFVWKKILKNSGSPT
jgi:group I intron endonuclease